MIAIIDYKAGNLTSVKRALDYLGIQCVVTYDLKEIKNAERIIFPGVGHAVSALATLKERRLDCALKDAFVRGTPILGICLGCQIILSTSEEGPTECLDLIAGKCVKFVLDDPQLKIPHMGWNSVTKVLAHPLLRTVATGDELYFVHSYYPKPLAAENVYATSEYEVDFACAIGQKNLFATQFHPEKSGEIGLSILKSFATWDGAAC